MTQRQLWGWADANPKLTPSQRLDKAIWAYQERHEDALPPYCFVHPATLALLEGRQIGCALYGTPGIPRNAYYFGLPGDVL